MKSKLGKGLLTGQGQSKAKGLLAASSTRTYLKGEVKAKRENIPAQEVESNTDIHPLNPRNQEALTLEAVRDIFDSIQNNGVNVEGVAVICPTSGKRLLLDASRRRFSCIHGQADLPLWVIQGEITDEQILAIINDSQEVKRWSYPEHAKYLLKVAERKGLDVECMKIKDLAKELSIGHESLRKRLEAHSLSLSLREVFVDYEGIPNSYYSELAKIQRKVEKENKNIDDVLSGFSFQVEEELKLDVAEVQSLTLNKLKEFIENTLGSKKKVEWEKSNLAVFDDRKAYARSSKSPDGQAVKYEFSRIGAEKLRLIDNYIQQLLGEE